MGNMVVNVDSGELTCNSSPRSCSTTLTASWNTATSVSKQTSLFRSLTGSLSLVGSQAKGIGKSLAGSLGAASGFVEHTSLFRSLAGSFSAVSGIARQSSLFRSLTGSFSTVASQVKLLAEGLNASLGIASGLVRQSSLFRSLSGSLSLAASQVKGLAKSLSGSLAVVSGLVEHTSLFKSLTVSLTTASGLARQASLFRSLAASLTVPSALVEHTSISRSLTGSLSVAPGLLEHTSIFRSLTGSLSTAASQTKGISKSLIASLSAASGLVKHVSLFRSLTGSLNVVSGLARQSSLFRSLTGSLTVASGLTRQSAMLRSLTGSLGLAASQTGVRGTANVHTFYLGSSPVGSCSGKCENLSTSAGTADSGTSQSVGNSLGTYAIEPDIASSVTTGTPSTSSVSGYAWVDNNDRSVNIQAGTWRFDLTVAASTLQNNPVGNLWITVWNCPTNSLVSCTFLFKNWDNSTNVLGNNGPTGYIFTTGTVGPFSGVHFLAVEYWIVYTVK